MVKKFTKEEEKKYLDFEMVLTSKKNLRKILKEGQIRKGNKFLTHIKDKEFVEVFLFDTCTPLGGTDVFVWHRHLTKEEFDKLQNNKCAKPEKV